MKGFKVQSKGVVFRIRFNSWNDKTVRCRLLVEHQSGILKGFYSYEGKAFCNIDEDEFDLQIGEELSFERAYKKYKNDIDSFFNRMVKERKKYNDAIDMLYHDFYKLESMQDKYEGYDIVKENC